MEGKEPYQIISQDILFCINITEVMELRLQYILHFLGSNISNNSLKQLNSNTCKSRVFVFESSHTDTHLARQHTHARESTFLKRSKISLQPCV